MPLPTSRLQPLLAAHREMARQFFHPALRRALPRRRRRAPLPVFFWSQVGWDTVWQRPQEEALGLARHRPVIYCAPVQVHEYATRLAERWEFCRVLEGGRLIVLSPLIFSGEYRHRLIRSVNAGILTKILAFLHETGPFLYLTNTPFAWPLVENIPPAGVAVDLIDDFCAFSWAPEEGPLLQQRLLARADLVITGTGFLRDRFAPVVPALEYLPSGVNFDRFATPAPEPEKLKNLPGPRVLYVGTLNDRLNGALFREVAEAVPHGSVVVVGPRHETFSAPPLPKNVHFIGLLPHQELPGWMQHCQLGIMPFADSPAARAINPIKTLEYLACGLPVLSSPVPDVVRYYEGVVETALPGAWTERVRALLAADTPEARERRIAFARGRTWSALTEALEERLRRLEAPFAR